MVFQFTSIESIRHIDKGKQVDVIGIVTNVEANRRVTKRNGDEADLRRVTIKDTSNCSIEVLVHLLQAFIHTLRFRSRYGTIWQSGKETSWKN